MADITMCDNRQCAMRNTCYRARARPSYWQSWAIFEPQNGDCQHYIEYVPQEYWLQSDPQQKGWGPFETEESAWRYLFGRDSDERERDQHKKAGWYVGVINKFDERLANVPSAKQCAVRRLREIGS